MFRRRFLWSSFAVGAAACGERVLPLGSIDHGANNESPIAEPTSDVASNAALVAGANRFAVELWQKMAASGNLAVSPTSISLAFAMTYGGARGETAAEMARTFHFDEADGDVHQGYGSMLRSWNDPNRTAYELAIANRLFGEQTIEFREAFLALTRDAYAAALEGLDFSGDPEACRRHINDWIAGETRQRIRDLLPPRSIVATTRLVLTNAIYFKGRWLREFDRRATRPAPFRVRSGEEVSVQTMFANGEYRYAQLDGVSVLELPYVGEELAMLFVLPDASADLGALETRMDAGAIERWARAVRPSHLDVSIPRFKIDPAEPIRLKPMLEQLGMRLAFEGGADFTGMADNEELFISEAFHKAFVEVNEEGTEAAAATAVVMREAAAAVTPTFTCDHPFLFFIRDTRNGAILFIGRVDDPS